MKNKKEWETKSLDWIHKVREEIDKEIRSKGMTPAQCIKARGKIDIEQLCEKMGLKNVVIVNNKSFPKHRKVQVG
jgi:hypothetical protein